jgi:hypothetical protein
MYRLAKVWGLPIRVETKKDFSRLQKKSKFWEISFNEISFSRKIDIPNNFGIIFLLSFS